MEKDILQKYKNKLLFVLFVLVITYLVVLLGISIDGRFYKFFVVENKFSKLIFDVEAENFFAFIMITIFIFVYYGNKYFKTKRKYEIERGIEKRLTRNKINENSIIKCNNKNFYIFFNCNYVGKPSTKRRVGPLKILIDMMDSLMFPESQISTKIKQYYCPKCGKEIYDNNLLENFNFDFRQKNTYKIFKNLTIISFFLFFFFVEEIIRLGFDNIWAPGWLYAAILYIFILGLIMTVLLKD